MSELSVSARQTEDNRQLEDLKQEHERKLAKLRAEQQTKEEETRAQGDAAINHIRTSTEKRIDSLRSESDEKLRREEEAIRQNYNSLRKRALLQNEGLEREINKAAEESRTIIQGMKDSESRAMRRSQEQLREFLQDQADLKAKTVRSVNADIEKAERRGNEQILGANRKMSGELRDIEIKHKDKTENARKFNREIYEQTRTQAERRLQELRADQAEKINKERVESHTTMNELRQKFRQSINEEQQSAEKRIDALETENARRWREARDRSVLQNERIQAEYSLEQARIEDQGEDEIRDIQTKFNQLRRKQDAQNDQKLRKMEDDFLTREMRLRKQSESRAQEVSEALETKLRQKYDDFKKRFSVNERAHRDSLDNQRELFLKQQYRDRLAQDEHVRIQQNRASDPFYRPQSFDANLKENADLYILEAKVAPHEKDSVEVRVQDDRITLSARRAYEDDHRDGNMRVTTNSHQTWRQEFKLNVPAEPKSMVKTIKDDGSIQVLVSKKGMGPTSGSTV